MAMTLAEIKEHARNLYGEIDKMGMSEIRPKTKEAASLVYYLAGHVQELQEKVAALTAALTSAGDKGNGDAA